MNAGEFEYHLKNQLLPFWDKMEDKENGGFYGYADEHGIPDDKSVKSCILNSRILWFYSASYRLLNDRELLRKAGHAFDFLRDRFFDSTYHGVFWSVNADGTPADTTKHTYNLAFAVYALSEYYLASGDKGSLQLAYDLYHTIEGRCLDKAGYLEAFGRDYTPASNEKLSENGVMAHLTMNTILHVMEAYTVLYDADGSEKVKDSLFEILNIIEAKIYNARKESCEVFFDMDYHSLISLESYGHNIEASWLIDRACEVLGDREYRDRMLPVIDGLANGAYNNGLDENTHALNNECENGITDTGKIWWVQAEAVTGFYNAYQLHPEKSYYKEQSALVWQYIQDHIIDKNTGEWIELTEADNSIRRGQALVHPWKCPYHNGRMCIEMIRRLGIQ
ncbi:MAG: AGE family epimerase/isomerase [Lachnospiraceae bacterium]|nr:AGE family epimerase/isomerase [Lachnospiraceae bacterium]